MREDLTEVPRTVQFGPNVLTAKLSSFINPLCLCAVLLFKQARQGLAGYLIMVWRNRDDHYTPTHTQRAKSAQTVGGVAAVCQQEAFRCIWKGASKLPWLRRPKWGRRMTLFVISRSREPPALRGGHLFCRAPLPTPQRSPLPHVSSHTSAPALLSNPLIMTQCATTWQIICRYTSVVRGSRCWLLRMSPIAPHGTAQKVCARDEPGNAQCAVPIRPGDGGNVLPLPWLIYSLSLRSGNAES